MFSTEGIIGSESLNFLKIYKIKKRKEKREKRKKRNRYGKRLVLL